jgi:hypothetical protein
MQDFFFFWKIVLLLMYGRGLGFWGSPNSPFFYHFSVLGFVCKTVVFDK